MSDYTTAVKYAMFFFMALMLIEWIASKISNKKVYQISDTISSISSGMTNNIKSIFIKFFCFFIEWNIVINNNPIVGS